MDSRENKWVLIRGGRGFIGRALGKLLQRAGYGVVSLDRELPGPASPKQASLNHSRTQLNGESGEANRTVVCDIADGRQLGRVFEERPICEMIHLAAILPTAAQRDLLRATQVNIDGSLNLLEMARQFGVRRVVFGSSLSVYRTCPASQIVTEADRAAPEDLYGAAKLDVEQLGETYRARHGVEFASLRIGRVVGPGAQSESSPWRSQIFEFLGAARPAEIVLPYAGSERLLLVQVDDVARMLATLLQAARPAHSIYNAPCESVVAAELKRDVEGLNPIINVRLGDQCARGNPRLLDATRFQGEFGFRTEPILEQLKRATGKQKL